MTSPALVWAIMLVWLTVLTFTHVASYYHADKLEQEIEELEKACGRSTATAPEVDFSPRGDPLRGDL